MKSLLRYAFLAAAAALALPRCAGPTPTFPPKTVDLAIEVSRAPDPILAFFEADVHVRLSGDGWITEWVVPEGDSLAPVPSGAVKLDMWTIVYGDTLACATDPTSGSGFCSQPVIGIGETCSLTMELAPETIVAVRFHRMAEEHCRLDRKES